MLTAASSSPTLAARRVSIIVPCRNEKKHIGRFLDTLLSQQLQGLQPEIIIADGMSDDGTRNILTEYAEKHDSIHVIDNPQRIVSTGLNAAIRAASAEAIVRMDAHTEYAPDYVYKCLETLESTGAENVGGAPRVRAQTLRMKVLGSAYHSPFAVGGARSHSVEYEGYVDSVFYGCWRKSTLLRMGLFDEDLVRNQDDELNLRITRAGGKIWQSPQIVCWYSPRASVASLFRQYFQYGFWKVAVIRKHHIPASWRHLVPGIFVIAHALLLLTMLVGLLTSKPQFVSQAGIAWLGMMLLYSLFALIAATAAARRWSWLVLPFLPPLYLVYHLSYGLGFVLGLFYWPLRSKNRAPAPSWTSTLTR